MGMRYQRGSRSFMWVRPYTRQADLAANLHVAATADFHALDKVWKHSSISRARNLELHASLIESKTPSPRRGS
eukprot:7012180-Pyramimonas_sp.AAC.1